MLSGRVLLSYARYLGIDPETEPRLVEVARQALFEPLPPGWERHLNEEYQMPYFFSEATGTTWEHPLLARYLARIDELRQRGAAASSPFPRMPPPPQSASPLPEPSLMHQPMADLSSAVAAATYHKTTADASSEMFSGRASSYAPPSLSLGATPQPQTPQHMLMHEQVFAQQQVMSQLAGPTFLGSTLPPSRQLVDHQPWLPPLSATGPGPGTVTDQHLRVEQLLFQQSTHHQHPMQLSHPQEPQYPHYPQLQPHLQHFHPSQQLVQHQQILQHQQVLQHHHLMQHQPLQQFQQQQQFQQFQQQQLLQQLEEQQQLKQQQQLQQQQLQLQLQLQRQQYQQQTREQYAHAQWTLEHTEVECSTSTPLPTLSLYPTPAALQPTPAALQPTPPALQCTPPALQPTLSAEQPSAAALPHVPPALPPAPPALLDQHLDGRLKLDLDANDSHEHRCVVGTPPSPGSAPSRAPPIPHSAEEGRASRVVAPPAGPTSPSAVHALSRNASTATASCDWSPRSEQEVWESSGEAGTHARPGEEAFAPNATRRAARDKGERQAQRRKWQQYMACLQAQPDEPTSNEASVGDAIGGQSAAKREEAIRLEVETSSLWRRHADLEGGREIASGSDAGSDEDDIPSFRDLVAVIKGVGSALQRTGKAVGSSKVMAKAASRASAAVFATETVGASAFAAIRRVVGYAEVLPSVATPPAMPSDPEMESFEVNRRARDLDEREDDMSIMPPPLPAAGAPAPCHAALASAVVELRLFCEQQTHGLDEARRTLNSAAQVQLAKAIDAAKERLARSVVPSQENGLLMVGDDDTGGGEGSEVATLLAEARDAREARVLEAERALQAFDGRARALYAVALEDLRCKERAPSSELVAADQALRKLDSAAAFELEQVLWRGGLRGAALQARVAAELEELRSEWLSHKEELEARARAEEERAAAGRQRRAARCQQEIRDAAAYMLARVQPSVAEAYAHVMALVVRALYHRVETLYSVYVEQPDISLASPTALVDNLATCVERLGIKVTQEMMLLDTSYRSSCASALHLTGSYARDVAAMAIPSSDEEIHIAASGRMLDERRLLFIHELDQNLDSTLNSYKTVAQFVLKLGEAVAVKAFHAGAEPEPLSASPSPSSPSREANGITSCALGTFAASTASRDLASEREAFAARPSLDSTETFSRMETLVASSTADEPFQRIEAASLSDGSCEARLREEQQRSSAPEMDAALETPPECANEYAAAMPEQEQQPVSDGEVFCGGELYVASSVSIASAEADVRHSMGAPAQIDKDDQTSRASERTVIGDSLSDSELCSIALKNSSVTQDVPLKGTRATEVEASEETKKADEERISMEARKAVGATKADEEPCASTSSAANGAAEDGMDLSDASSLSIDLRASDVSSSTSDESFLREAERAGSITLGSRHHPYPEPVSCSDNPAAEDDAVALAEVHEARPQESVEDMLAFIDSMGI